MHFTVAFFDQCDTLQLPQNTKIRKEGQMEAVEIFTILERAKMERLANICKEGNKNPPDTIQVLCEERGYAVLMEVTSKIIDTLGPEIIPLYNAVTDLVMKEEGRKVVHPEESDKLPDDIRQGLTEILNQGVLDVDCV